MKVKDINRIYSISDNVVAREIEGEIIIIPISSDIRNSEDEIFTLNENARAIWEKLNGKNTLKDIINKIESKFQAAPEKIQKDVLGFTEELSKRNILIEVKNLVKKI